jgi:ADP-ribose pyrophosphatase YjhB (NUDIX family)
MWLITTRGFFSIVEKPGDAAEAMLTIRARVRADLEALREVLPTLGAISDEGGTDYPFRARAPRQAVAAAMAELVGMIDYANFKNAVADRQGHARAATYGEVWSTLHTLTADAKAQARTDRRPPSIPKADAYGGVLVDEAGRVLLREPKGHFGGYVWTFPKGRPDPGRAEAPDQVALREVREETGYCARIVAAIADVFPGTTTKTAFFLMEPMGKPQAPDAETASVRWVPFAEAPALIAQSTTTIGRERDLAVLAAAEALWRASRPSR